MIVYLLSSGEYSGYHVRHATLSLEIAEELVRRNPAYMLEERDLVDWLADAVDVLIIRGDIYEHSISHGYQNDAGPYEEHEILTPGLDDEVPGPCATDSYVSLSGNPTVALTVKGTDHDRVRKVWSERAAQITADFAIIIERDRMEREALRVQRDADVEKWRRHQRTHHGNVLPPPYDIRDVLPKVTQ